MDIVCSRNHKIDRQVLDVKEYHEWLVESNEEGQFQPPAPVEISEINGKKLQFLTSSTAVNIIKLLGVYGKPIWPKTSKLITLTV